MDSIDETLIVNTLLEARDAFNSGNVAKAISLMEKVNAIKSRIKEKDPNFKDPSGGLMDILISLLKTRGETGDEIQIEVSKISIDVPDLLEFIKNEAIEWEEISPLKSINLHKISLVLLFRAVEENKGDEPVLKYLNKQIGEVSMRVTKLDRNGNS